MKNVRKHFKSVLFIRNSNATDILLEKNLKIHNLLVKTVDVYTRNLDVNDFEVNLIHYTLWLMIDGAVSVFRHQSRLWH